MKGWWAEGYLTSSYIFIKQALDLKAKLEHLEEISLLFSSSIILSLATYFTSTIHWLQDR